MVPVTTYRNNYAEATWCGLTSGGLIHVQATEDYGGHDGRGRTRHLYHGRDADAAEVAWEAAKKIVDQADCG